MKTLFIITKDDWCGRDHSALLTTNVCVSTIIFCSILPLQRCLRFFSSVLRFIFPFISTFELNASCYLLATSDVSTVVSIARVVCVYVLSFVLLSSFSSSLDPATSTMQVQSEPLERWTEKTLRLLKLEYETELEQNT